MSVHSSEAQFFSRFSCSLPSHDRSGPLFSIRIYHSEASMRAFLATRHCITHDLTKLHQPSYLTYAVASKYNKSNRRLLSGSLPLRIARGKGVTIAGHKHHDEPYSNHPSHLKKLDPLYLRGSCRCPKCVDQSTTQRLFDFAAIPETLAIQSFHFGEDGTLTISWENDAPRFENHKSEYAPEYLEELEKKLHIIYPSRAWDRRHLVHVRNDLNFDYHDYLHNETTLYKAVHHLLYHGIAFITSVPSEHSSVSTIARRIGPLRNSFYGETWDVKSVPSAKNVAYTSQDLGFHMDLLYMTDPPGIQFLHCLKATSIGGESLFSDALQAFYEMQDHAKAGSEEDKRALQGFLDYPVVYRYKNDGQWYQRSRSFLEGGLNKLHPQSTLSDGFDRRYPQDFEAINWSPPFQGPLEVATRESETGTDHRLKAYRDGAAEFKAILEKPSNVYETKLDDGTCVIFNNRRVTHARRAFDTSEPRHLRGAYVDSDPLVSHYRVLREKYDSVDHLQ